MEVIRNVCKCCGKEIITGNGRIKKFCNSSCAAKYNNCQRIVTEEQKRKTSKSLLQNHANKLNLTIEEYKTIPRDSSSKLKHKCVCIICGKEFLSSCKNTKHCSSACCGKDPQIQQKMRNKVKERINNGTFSGGKSRNITSYSEEFGIKVLKDNNISFVREDFSTKKYFLDFLIEKNGVKIDLEIDGKQHKYPDRLQHDKERDMYLESIGYKVYRVDGNSINTDSGKNKMRDKISKFLEFYNSL